MDAVSPWWATPPDPAPALEDVYDARTLAALDAGVEPAPEADDPCEAPGAARGWRASLAGGAVLADIALGLREVLDPDPGDEGVLEVRPDPGLEPVDGITIFFVPDDPRATVAVVRRPA
ncbi:MAG: hypothetical protein KDB10_05550 [Acidimicrobiales bacterium]|nr:hypothetical protein [Acidimicrobiales bacterium]MCB9373224.1 hypothetical protein [Microthrixaceae bacterium]